MALFGMSESHVVLEDDKSTGVLEDKSTLQIEDKVV